MFNVAAYTDIGPRKATNQDSTCALVAQADDDPVALIAVCDGVGGLSAGELASGSLVQWFAEWFEETLPGTLQEHAGSFDELLNSVEIQWSAGLGGMNGAILAYGDQNGMKLGTTCSAALLIGGRCLIAQVGDSRVYRFSRGEMSILTEDQTWVAQEVARGNIPREQARFHPKRNVILQAVGAQPSVNPVFSRCEYGVGDVFMACCDGFRNELFDDELVDGFCAMSGADAEQMEAACKDFVALVLQRGEQDNISVVCAACVDGLETAGAAGVASATDAVSAASAASAASSDVVTDEGRVETTILDGAGAQDVSSANTNGDIATDISSHEPVPTTEPANVEGRGE